MQKIQLTLLRGICQTPAYVACERGLFADEGLDADFTIAPTAWLVPEQLAAGTADFAVIPWTRVATTATSDLPLRAVCGSGYEEAALVVKRDVPDDAVRSVAVPREGGMKDLTAMGLINEMGWEHAVQLRYPSGDGAIIALVGGAADAASMIEPYATMLSMTDAGRIVRRTGDVWPGAPGCVLSCTAATVERHPELVHRVVRAYVRAIDEVTSHPDEAAQIAGPRIGVEPRFVTAALETAPPRADGICNTDVMHRILSFMCQRGYLDHIPQDFADVRFLKTALGHGPTR